MCAPCEREKFKTKRACLISNLPFLPTIWASFRTIMMTMMQKFAEENQTSKTFQNGRIIELVLLPCACVWAMPLIRLKLCDPPRSVVIGTLPPRSYTWAPDPVNLFPIIIIFSNWHCIKDKPLGWSLGQLSNPRLMRPQHCTVHPPFLPKPITLSYLATCFLFTYIAFENKIPRAI